MRFKKLITITAWVCLGLILVCFFLFINLPWIVESQIQKRRPQFLNPVEFNFYIQKIGFSNTFISKIQISKAISIDSIDIDYDIKGLSSIHLTRVRVSGLTIHAGLDDNNQIKIQGLTFAQESKEKTGPLDLSFLSFLPDKIVLQNAKLILTAGNETVLIPFDVLSTIDLKDGKILAGSELYPFGEKINAHVTYDLKKGIDALKIEGKSFDLGHVAAFISKKNNGVQLNGQMDFNLETRSPRKKWELNLSRIDFVHPLEMTLADLSTIVFIDDQRIRASGTFGLSHAVLPSTQMEYGLTLDLQKDHLFDLKVHTGKTGGREIAYGSIQGSLKNYQLNARVTGTALKSKGKLSIRLNQGQVQYQKDSLTFADARIESTVDVDLTDQGRGVSAKSSVTADHIRIMSGKITSTFPSAGFSGLLSLDKNNHPFIKGTLKAVKGNISAPEVKTTVAGITLELPVQYPHKGGGIYGKYDISAISYDNRYTVRTGGKILQTGAKKFQVSGSAGFPSVPVLNAQFDSSVTFEKGVAATLDFKTDPVKLKSVDIEKLILQRLGPTDVDVMALATGKLEFWDHQFKTFLRLDIKDGKISIPDMKFSATGLNTSVTVNDLLALKSVPGQVLTIDSIKADKVKIEDAKVRFTLEQGNSLLIENIRFKWCNGLVSTEAIRFPQKNKAYSLTLYCDRLEMTQLLKQMGAFNAEGTGTLNGRIPVVYSDGIISFDNGFLFSTPGKGGKLVVQNTNRIIAGIPMDSPQFVQLDLAQEALKAFDYEWAKLVFNTFEDMLYVNMELDGKPSKLMPFEYRKDLGKFIRVDASSPGSRFQGIKLDVNLKLPFNDVLKFGNKLKSIFK